MKKPYNSRARIVLDIAIQAAFWAVILAAFWFLYTLMP
jgi:hypothetical protein